MSLITKEETRRLLEKQIKPGVVFDINLMLAMIEVESSFNPWQIRYEPNYNYTPLTPALFSTKHIITLDTEKQLQKCSFGLFQIMGLGAREIGFKDNLTKLLDPEINIIWGVEFYRQRCKARYSKLEDQVASYNAGTARKDKDGLYIPNKTDVHVKKVMACYKENIVSKLLV